MTTVTHRLEVTSGDKEKLVDTWSVTVDPGAGTIEYGVRAIGSTAAPAAWVAGTVGGEQAWTTTTDIVKHLTPLIGAAGAGIVLTAGTSYELLGRLTVGGEVMVRLVAVIHAV